jgi:hypothetical protein
MEPAQERTRFCFFFFDLACDLSEVVFSVTSSSDVSEPSSEMEGREWSVEWASSGERVESRCGVDLLFRARECPAAECERLIEETPAGSSICMKSTAKDASAVFGLGFGLRLGRGITRSVKAGLSSCWNLIVAVLSEVSCEITDTGRPTSGAWLFEAISAWRAAGIGGTGGIEGEGGN